MAALHITLPPLHLTDHLNRITLTFTATLTVHLPASIPLDLWRTALLLPAQHLPLRLSGSYNSTPLPDSWSTSISRAAMWPQLCLSASLCTSPLTITLSSPPLPVGGGVGCVVGVDMAFEFAGPGRKLVPLTDAALRGFWEEKVAALVPVLGRVGVRGACEDRVGFVEIVAGVLGRECRRDCEAVLTEVWRVVVGNLKARGSLMCVEDVGGAEDEDGMLAEEDYAVRGLEGLMVDGEDKDMLYDSEDEDLLAAESEDEFAWHWGLDTDGDETAYAKPDRPIRNWEDLMAVEW